jgi:5-methylthioadenosine/S-adenosylhomocysteine deaminase
MMKKSRALFIRGGRVLSDGMAVDRPAPQDILIEDGVIRAIGPNLQINDRSTKIIDASDRLVIPGFVNAHYHSHDVLLKGSFEAIPREAWLLNALPPNYPRRPPAEIRARTILGAIECLRSGMTTVQDMLTLDLSHPEDLEVVLAAYEEVGIRCVIAPQVGDVHGAAVTPYWREVFPKGALPGLGGAVASSTGAAPVISALEGCLSDYAGRSPLISWGLGPSSPERSSPELLAGLKDLSERFDAQIFTHVYESRATTVIGRQLFGKWGGSLVAYLEAHGLLNARLTIAHGVWMRQREIDRIAESGASVVLNPVGNLKTQSGIAPIPEYAASGVTLGLGCDNCSCSDAQNMFQTMKAFAGLAAVSTREPNRVSAGDAFRAATLGGAAAIGLGGQIGAVRVGMRADLTLLDLADPSFVPLNSALRQVVFTECGRAVDTVIVDGRVLLQDKRMLFVDEAALRRDVETAMEVLRGDINDVVTCNDKLAPYMAEAHRLTSYHPLEMTRYVPSLAETDPA